MSGSAPGYKENFVRKQLDRACILDRAKLLNQESRCIDENKDHIQLVVTFHPALNEIKDMI